MEEAIEVRSVMMADARNPMLNHLVLQSFFHLCELKDLRRFRLVCKLWYDLSLHRWRDEMVLYIGSDFSGLNRRHEGRETLHWPKVSLLFKLPSIVEKPFRKFVLGDCKFPRGRLDKEYAAYDSTESDDSSLVRTRDLKRKQVLLNFWTKVGPWMRELELCAPQIDSISPRFFRRVITQFTPNCHTLKLSDVSTFTLGRGNNMNSFRVAQPNLKSLSITLSTACYKSLCSRSVRDLLRDKSLPWYHFFLLFPNLETLEWNNFLDGPCIHLMNDVERLRNEGKLAGRHNKLKIKVNDINRHDSDCSVRVLNRFFQNSHFTFEHLGLELGNCGVVEGTLASALELHQSTLHSVHIYSTGRRGRGIRNPFSVLQNFLTELDLSCHSVANLDFLEFTPNLKTLFLPNENLSKVVKATKEENVEGGCVQLEKLHYLQVGRFTCSTISSGSECESALNIFVRWMPNVKIFKCPLTTKSFRVVCEHWQDLRQLVDCAQDICDEGITGIVPEQEGRLPNITDLKYLREFRTNSCLLKDQSVWDGFLKLEHLTCLEVSLSDQTSNEAFSALFSKFRTGVCRCESELKWKQTLNREMELASRVLSKYYGISLRKSSYTFR